MARYILDIPDKIIAHIRADYGHGVKWINEEDRKILVELIYNAKPVGEIKQVTLGKWEWNGDYICSECGGISTRTKFPFCPNCGAKMKGDTE